MGRGEAKNGRKSMRDCFLAQQTIESMHGLMACAELP
jgi:hypothetical protein